MAPKKKAPDTDASSEIAVATSKKARKQDAENGGTPSGPLRKAKGKGAKRSQGDEEAAAESDGEAAERALQEAAAKVDDDGEFEQAEEDDEDDDDDDDDDEAPALVVSQVNKNAEAGIIEKLVAQDFMCHSALEVPFGPNINFIIGENGSGKSAILVALLVCLGQKASKTMRGDKSADLIKAGCTSCVIQVTIKNSGNGAFEHERYGDRITVVKRISRTGGASLRLLNDEMQTVSTSSKELRSMLDQFNIQIGNPCAILMQDMARKFLTENSNAEKYKFFMTGTQLEDMKRNLILVRKELIAMRETIEGKAGAVQELQEKASVLKAELESLRSLQQLFAAVGEARLAVAWKHAQEKEQEHSSLLSQISELTSARARMQSRMDERAKERASLQEQAGGKRKLVEDRSAEFEARARAKREAEARLAEHKRLIANKRTESNNEQKKLDNLRGRIKKQTDAIAALEAEQKAEEEADVAAHQREIDAAKKQLAEMEAVAREKNKVVDELQAGLAALEEQAQNGSRDLDVAQRAVQQAKRTEDGLAEAQRSGVQSFGWEGPLAALQAAIDQERRWQKRPIGPIGQYVKLKDRAWADAIESTIGSLLPRFVVNSQADERLFKQLFQNTPALRGRFMPSLIVQRIRDEEYKISPNALPAENHLTVMRAITVSHPMVMNVLIDQAGVESTVLVKDVKEAERVIYSDGQNGHKNISKAVLPNGTSAKLVGGSHQMQHIFNKARYMTEDLSGQYRQAQQERAERERALAPIQQQQQQLQDQIRRARMDIDRASKAAGMASREEHRAKDKLRALSNEIPNRERARQGAADTTRSMVESLMKQEQEMLEKMHNLARQLEELQKAEAPLQEKVANCASVDAAGDAEAEGLNSELNKLTNLIVTAEREVTKLTGEAAKVEGEIRKVRAMLDTAQKASEEAAEKASVIGPKPEHLPDKDAKALQDEAEKKQRLLAREQERKRDPVVVQQEYEEARTKHQRAEAVMEDSQKLLTLLRESSTNRQKVFLQFRKSISKRTSNYFNMYLSRKGHSGEVVFDHEEGKLDIDIKLDNTLSATPHIATQPSRGTETLSGGEKSFATLALLLALWETMESPFRAMDEFDVYMDSIRREISIDMLVEVAKNNRARQFVFITPQDPSAIKRSPEMRIHKLRRPDRSGQQSELSFAPGPAGSQA